MAGLPKDPMSLYSVLNTKLRDFYPSLDALCEDWFPGVIRAKGMVWYREDPDMAYILEQSGRQITEQQAGLFIASAPKKDQKELLKRYLAAEQQRHHQRKQRVDDAYLLYAQQSRAHRFPFRE